VIVSVRSKYHNERLIVRNEAHILFVFNINKEYPSSLTTVLVGILRTQSLSSLEITSSPLVGFGELNDNTIKGLTSLLSVEQEIKYMHTHEYCITRCI
jgi:hypothetical protein